MEGRNRDVQDRNRIQLVSEMLVEHKKYGLLLRHSHGSSIADCTMVGKITEAPSRLEISRDVQRPPMVASGVGLPPPPCVNSHSLWYRSSHGNVLTY